MRKYASTFLLILGGLFMVLRKRKVFSCFSRLDLSCVLFVCDSGVLIFVQLVFYGYSLAIVLLSLPLIVHVNQDCFRKDCGLSNRSKTLGLYDIVLFS